LIKTLNDENQSLKVRGKAAKALAGLGTSEAMSALKSALVTGSDSLRASIAAALGESQDPQSASMLRGLLTDKAESVALAAVQALAQQGSPEAVAALSQLLYNTATPLNVRCEAALGLGEINQPGVVESLSHAAATIGDESIVTQILNALGSRPIEETRGFFESYLHSPTASAELKITAIEALGQAQGDPSALLLDVVRNPDAELRAAAAWALSSTDVQGNLGAQLTAILQNEADPDVRRRLYQALGNQEGFDVASIQALIQKESDPAARIAGMDLLAQNLRSNPSSALSSYFDQNEVPDLKNLALTSETSQERMAAVTALKRAATAGSLAALQELALLSTDKRVTDSANATFAKGPGRR
jgi:HEAT repeat protein